MTNPTNEKKVKAKTNFELILQQLEPEWRADPFKFIFSRYTIMIFALIVLMLWQLSSNIFNDIINWSYENLISIIPFNSITIMATIILAVAIFLFYIHKIFIIQYRPNLNLTFLVLFAGIFYFPERWYEKWEFYKFWESPLALVDIYWIFIIGEILSWINFLSRKHFDEEIKSESFGLDDPLDNEDEFNRKNFASQITDYICNSLGKRALAVGISGSWGTGKSFLLHQIQESLKQKKDKNIIQIRFNPWRSSSHNRIIEDFLNTLKSELSTYDKSLSNKFEKYLQILIKNKNNSWFDSLSNSLDILNDKPSEELYNEINICLKLISKKLIIFIDDLDRLHNEEIIEVFRIIRNTADFYNTCFVVAYDRDYVQRSLRTPNIQMSNYLDKIFQTEFVLPSVDLNIMIEVIIGEIFKRAPNNEKLQQEIKQVFSDAKRKNLILDLIIHKRDAIRFTNMFLFDFKAIQEDTDYGEFIFVMLLKMKFPSVYNLLLFRENKNILLDVKKDENRKIYKLLPKGYDALKERNPQVFNFMSTAAIENVQAIFDELFGREKDISIQSIRFVENYYRYFSIREFWQVISYPFPDAKKKIDNLVKDKRKGNLDILFLNFKITDFEDLQQIRNYIYGMKKVSIRINLKEAVTQFHVALNNGGFFKDNFKDLLKNESESDIDQQITEILFPEGIMDAYNGIFIEQLYLEGEEGNNLYSKEKSKELVINRFNETLNKSRSIILLIQQWKVIISGKDFNSSDDGILNLTNRFAYFIQQNWREFKSEISLLYERDKKADNNNENKAQLTNSYFSKEFDIVKDLIKILTNEYRYSTTEKESVAQYDDKKQRFGFFRQLCLDLLIPYRRMNEFIENMGIIPEKYKSFNSYESQILKYYPIKKEKFGKFDKNVFQLLEKEYHSFWQNNLKS
jgi:hypothetical protein